MLDSSWFPVLLEDVTFNVFTFTFPRLRGRLSGVDREGWKLDVKPPCSGSSVLRMLISPGC